MFIATYGKLLETRFYKKRGKLRLFFGKVLEDTEENTHRSVCFVWSRVH